jgi:hypothetical protein
MVDRAPAGRDLQREYQNDAHGSMRRCVSGRRAASENVSSVLICLSGSGRNSVFGIPHHAGRHVAAPHRPDSISCSSP